MKTTASDTVTIPWEPVEKERPRYARGRFYNPDSADEARTTWAMKAWWAPREPLKNLCAITVTFYVKQRRKVDIDNLLKHVMDAGNGVLWRDDSQICSVQMRMLEARPEESRTELRVISLED